MIFRTSPGGICDRSLEGITKKIDLQQKKGGECLMVMNIKKGTFLHNPAALEAFFQMVIS